MGNDIATLYSLQIHVNEAMFYEKNQGKSQENCEVLARKLRAGKCTRAPVGGCVYTYSADVRMVGHPGDLIQKQVVE